MDLGRPLFAARGEAFTVRDVLTWSLLAGLGGAAWERAGARLACAHLARVRRQAPSPEDTREGVRAWRRRRQLAAADRTRDWLAGYGLALADLTAYVERSLSFARLEQAWRGGGDAAPAPPEEVGRVLPAELCFEGELTPLARGCADAALLAPEAPHAGALAPPSQLLRSCAAWWGVAEGRLERLLALAHARSQALERLAGSAALQGRVSAERAALSRVELWAAPAPRASVALELLACLREEPSLSLPALCARHGLPAERRTHFLHELADPVLVARLLSARPGEPLGPVPGPGGALEVLELVERRPPDPADPAVRRRAAERLLELELGPRRERELRVLCAD